MRILFICAVICGISWLNAGVKTAEDGSFQLGETKFRINAMFGPQWQSIKISKASWVSTDNGHEFKAPVATSEALGVYGELHQTLKESTDGACLYSSRMNFEKPFNPNTIYAAFDFVPGSEVTLDGKTVTLPAAYEKNIVAEITGENLSINMPGGNILEIKGKLRGLIQDNRAKAPRGNFELRVFFSRSADQQNFTIDATIKTTKVSTRIVDISKAANRGFTDEAADDGKGGWTDQGAGNDLSMITPGIINLNALSFMVLDEKKNVDKTVLVVAGEKRGFAPGELVLELPENRASGLNLLHASAWTPGGPLGEITVRYRDGSEETLKISGRDDCGNWWGPRNLPNGYVVWRGYNSQSSVGLYASAFKLDKDSPEKLIFRIKNPEAVWMIAGVTLSDRPLTVPYLQQQQLIVREGKEWAKLDFNGKIPAGGPLDFSFILDAPAGKYGRVVPAPDGSLTFKNAPDRKLRLYGENLCEAATQLDRESAASLAAYLARMGINTLRIHHHDNPLVDPNAANSTTLNMETVDRLDYLVAELKKNGIYITTDLYTSRKLKPGDNVPGDLKSALPISEAAMNNWKTFTRNWLTHQNRYTGMTLGEDPVLVFVNLVNEDNLWFRWEKHPEVADMYRRKFETYCQEKGLKHSQAGNSNPVFRRFLDELQDAANQEMIRFIREDLKLDLMVTSQNFYGDLPASLLRNKFDIVDEHQYHDHPGFPEWAWGLPQTFTQQSSIVEMAAMPRRLMANRIWGKPFAVTEFCFTAPNIYRAEGGSLIGGYAALQDWNALYRFAYSFSAVNSSPRKIIHDFESANEPLAQFNDRITSALFVRGDAKSAPERYTLNIPENFYESGMNRNMPGDFLTLGLISGIGLSIGDSTVEDYRKISDTRIAELWQKALKERKAVSSTGELVLDAAEKTFFVNTPLTVTTTLPKGKADNGILKIDGADTFQTVALISRDGLPLTESCSIILFQLTDVCNSQIRFADEEKTWMESKGTLPLLVRRGKAQIGLATGHSYKITPLNCDGEAREELKGSLDNGVFRFEIRTDLYPGGIMAYHLELIKN